MVATNAGAPICERVFCVDVLSSKSAVWYGVPISHAHASSGSIPVVAHCDAEIPCGASELFQPALGQLIRIRCSG